MLQNSSPKRGAYAWNIPCSEDVNQSLSGEPHQGQHRLAVRRGAQTLGYAAVRAGHTVRFAAADRYFREIAQARVDRSVDKTFRSFLAPDLLILDDLGLHRLDQQQSIDLYELVIARHRTAGFAITSNRDVEEWFDLSDGPLLAGSALDRLASASCETVIDGESYRQRLSPHRALLEQQDVVDAPTAH